MSILRYLFDSDYKQRRDIEELREAQYKQALKPSGGVSERYVAELAEEVKELAATVHVLMRMLAEANLLDVAKVDEQVVLVLNPPKPAKGEKRAKAPEGPIVEVVCTKCATKGMSNEMVRIGADWMCRPCAKNP